MKCQKCGSENREGAKFCGVCGAKTDVEPTPVRTSTPRSASKCSSCGYDNPASSIFCNNCGQSLSSVRERPSVDAASSTPSVPLSQACTEETRHPAKSGAETGVSVVSQVMRPEIAVVLVGAFIVWLGLLYWSSIDLESELGDKLTVILALLLGGLTTVIGIGSLFRKNSNP